MNADHPDHPDYYDEDILRAWVVRFNSPEGFWPDGTPRITLPDIPFSYPEIARALIRLENNKEDE